MTVPVIEIIAAVLAAVALWSWRIVRGRPFWLRLVSSTLWFALLTASLIYIVGSPLQPRFSSDMSPDRLWQQIIVSLWWLLAARLAVEITRSTALIRRFSGEGQLFSDLLAGLVYLAVILTIVKTVFGFPIGGLVATSGIIAIVLGLALQNTLADVFAGIAVGIERPYAIGDLVWFEGPIEGEVVQINWRSVQIKTFGNDIATIPNSLVAKSRIINRSVPSTRRSDTVQLPCDATYAPEQVFELVQRAILLCPNVLENPAPGVALTRIGRRMNHYDISFSVAHSSQLWETKSMVLKEVLRQFRSSGITAPNNHDPTTAAVANAASPARHILDIPLFEGLPRETRNELEDKLIRKSLKPGDVLFAQGDTNASLLIVGSGVLEVSRSVNGTSTRIGRISADDYIGEIGMLTGAPHAATVTALTHCVVFELCKEAVAPLMKAQPQMLHAFEASARRGQALIDRSVAASVGAESVPSGQLLERMRAFFHMHGL
ncbi:MAG: mechanosensitive ion channel protein MscS [Rhodospirillales bacterium]|nr:mechanosensitive ion channel protein MscS [Rhodospirillales bacterium]